MRLRLLILLLLSLTFAGQAFAEPFVDVFGGWSKARATDSSASRQTCFILGCTGSAGTTQHQSFSSGAAAGMRGGYWFKAHPWFGLAGDLTYYRTASTQVSLDSFALAATPMLRLPLWTAPDLPQGRLQPYVGAGPTLVMHSVKANFRPTEPVEVSGWSMGVGWTVRAGLAVSMTEHVAVFGEWRLSQDRVALRDTGFLGAGDQKRLDMTQTVQQYVFGLSYRF